MFDCGYKWSKNEELGDNNMSEKLSQLTEDYKCETCKTIKCLTPSKVHCLREEMNSEGDIIKLEYDLYFCCTDSKITKCEFCINRGYIRYE